MHKQIISFTLAISLLFTSCATVPSSFVLNTQDEVRTMNEARISHAAIGAIVGAGLGVGIAALAQSGGDPRRMIAYGILGALAGLQHGDQKGVSKGIDTIVQKRKYAYTEAELARLTSNGAKYEEGLRAFIQKIGAFQASKDSAEFKSMIRQADKVMQMTDAEIADREKLLADGALPQESSVRMKHHLTSLKDLQKSLYRAMSKLTD